jgi:hypothetical protein
MKKFWVLFSLFILPLVFYIFLSKGIYKYANLPILTENILDISEVSNTTTTFKNHISVICFLGNDINTAKGSLFNLNETIYKRYHEKMYFQMVAILPKGSENDYEKILEKLSAFTNIAKWHFIYLDENATQTFFNSFNTPFELNTQLYNENAFIIDKQLRLRGRKDDEDTNDGKLYGYNMKSVAVLKNKMKDDIDIIYYQLKKSAEKEQRRKREI